MRRLTWLLVGILAIIAAGGWWSPAQTAPSEQALRDAILTQEDVGSEFELSREGQLVDPPVVSYFRSFQSQGVPVRTIVVDLVDVATDFLSLDLHVGAALDAFRDRGFRVSRVDPFAPVSDGAVAYTFSGQLSGESVTGEMMGWEYSGVRAVMSVFGMSNPHIENYAVRQQERLVAAFGPPGSVPSSPSPAPSSSPTPAPARSEPEPDVLLDVRGRGDRETDYFTTEDVRVQLCWEVSGRSPAANLDPYVNLTIMRASDLRRVNSFTVEFEEADCTFANIGPGTYYIAISATSWSNWRVIVRRA